MILASFTTKIHPPVKSILIALANEDLAEFSYEGIKNNNQFLSFVVHHERIAAYPPYHQTYYAFGALPHQPTYLMH